MKTTKRQTHELPLIIQFVAVFFFRQPISINYAVLAVVAKTGELCPSLLSKAREISVKFEQTFKLFAACHFVYDSAEYLDDEKVDQLGR